MYSETWNFWITFFWNATSKKRQKSRFLDFQKNVKNVFSNYAMHVPELVPETCSQFMMQVYGPCIMGLTPTKKCQYTEDMYTNYLNILYFGFNTITAAAKMSLIMFHNAVMRYTSF